MILLDVLFRETNVNLALILVEVEELDGIFSRNIHVNQWLRTKNVHFTIRDLSCSESLYRFVPELRFALVGTASFPECGV